MQCWQVFYLNAVSATLYIMSCVIEPPLKDGTRIATTPNPDQYLPWLFQVVLYCDLYM